MTQRIAQSVVVALAVLATVSCATAPPPIVPVEGTSPEPLVGAWWGHYTSVESGRQGRIRFELAADGTAAVGDVIMVPRRGVESVAGAVETPPEPPRTLRIRFVRMRGATLLGAMEPYDDPGCSCQVSTTFHGEVDGDVIEGTYVTEGGKMHLGHSGTWRVERRDDE